jgi:diacylglycerol O-acyltransferase / wax synthase
MTISNSSGKSHGHQADSLSWGDSFFLYLEREGQPLSIASISEFEGKIPLKACIDFVESKLPVIPRFRQRVMFPPFNVGLPVWQYDPKFDIRNHIREVKLEHGTEEELKATASSILSTILDRQRPLWDLTLIRGLKGNRTAIITRVHHCLADGIAGVRLMSALMDTTPRPAGPYPKLEPFHVPPLQDSGTLLLDGLFRSYFSVVERLLKVPSEVLGAGTAIPGLIDLMTELGMPAERLLFNKVCHGPHHMAWMEIPLSTVKEIKQVCGATVNDVILTVLTSAIHHYAHLHGVHLKGRSLRIVVPVNVRDSEDTNGAGNRITFVPLSVPLDLRDPVKLLAAVNRKMGYYKNAKVAEMVSMAGTMVGTIPTMLQAIAAPIASQLPLSVCNLICTNIPGPQTPLYFIDHKMTRCYPVVPIGGEMGMNCAVLSYNGMIYFGFHAGVDAVPDVERMEELIQVSFKELCEASGVHTVAKKRKQRTAPVRKTHTRKAAAGKDTVRENATRPASTREATQDE